MRAGFRPPLTDRHGRERPGSGEGRPAACPCPISRYRSLGLPAGPRGPILSDSPVNRIGLRGGVRAHPTRSSCPGREEGYAVDVGEYISARRAYNIVRQRTPPKQRLTFEEFSVLVLLGSSSHPLSISAIANWQHALRPTMTHRVEHLAALGLIDRRQDPSDRRNVACSITEAGSGGLGRLCAEIRQVLVRGKVLARVDIERIKQYVLAMGQHYMRASDLILVDLALNKRAGAPIALLVGSLGFPQPTVSMSVRALEDGGFVERAVSDAKSVKTRLTDRGRLRAEELIVRIERLVVRRKPRRSLRGSPAERD